MQEQHLVGGGEQDDAELVSRVPRGMHAGMKYLPGTHAQRWRRLPRLLLLRFLIFACHGDGWD